MKTFKNKQTQILFPKDSQNPKLGQKPGTYAEVCCAVMESESKKGINYGLMRKRLRVSEILEKAKVDKPISLEDADHQVLVDLLVNATYFIQHKDIETMISEIENAK